MAGHGEKLSRKQDMAISALLIHGTILDAAAAVGINEKTLRTWLALPAFREAYHAARREVVSCAVLKLQNAATEAVDTLQASLGAEAENVRVSAAKTILDLCFRGTDVLDLTEAIEELRGQLAEVRSHANGNTMAGGEKTSDGTGQANGSGESSVDGTTEGPGGDYDYRGTEAGQLAGGFVTVDFEEDASPLFPPVG